MIPLGKERRRGGTERRDGEERRERAMGTGGREKSREGGRGGRAAVGSHRTYGGGDMEKRDEGRGGEERWERCT
jgi:hypothetical protein